MKLLNNSHYFNKFSKVYNIVPDSHSFSLESSRRMGFYQRLYFEQLYTKSVGGVSFFYTFTYNDNALPYFLSFDCSEYDLHYFQHPCFSYSHIRLLTNGLISKVLHRQYGAKLRYFCACERGEGKGVRGLGNNPHYHIIFFITPDDESKVTYKTISASDFYALCCRVWQGSINSDWQQAKFGHVQPGNNFGLILGTDAFKYVAKYCVKDSADIACENKVREYYLKYLRECGITTTVLYDFFNYLNLNYSESNQGYYITKEEYFKMFALAEYNQYRHKHPSHPSYSAFLTYCSSFRSDPRYCDIVSRVSQLLDWFNNQYLVWAVDWLVSNYRREMSGKVRLSKSLGEYGLNFIDSSDPRVSIPSGKKIDVQYPCLYYIRKKFYKTFVCPVTGHVLYRLNEDGIKLKVITLDSRLDSLRGSVKSAVDYCFRYGVDTNFRSLGRFDYYGVGPSDMPNVFSDGISHPSFFDSPLNSKLFDFVNLGSSSINDIINRYSIYKLVFEFRSMWTQLHEDFLPNSCIDNYHELYSHHLHLDVCVFDYDSSSIYRYVEKNHPFMYSNHIDFEPYLDWFELLDCVLDVFHCIQSDNNKALFRDKCESLKKFNSLRFNESSLCFA